MEYTLNIGQLSKLLRETASFDTSTSTTGISTAKHEHVIKKKRKE